MAVHRGFGATIGLGEEVTWGTAVARTHWLRPMRTGLRRTRTHVPLATLGDLSQTSTIDKTFYVESDFAGGSFQIPMAYDDSTLLVLKHLLGGLATSGASAPYTHALTPASLPVGLTIEQINGTPGTGNMTEVFEGCRLTSGRISIEAGGIMMLEAEVIAETSGGLAAAGTPTYNTTREYIKHNHAGTMTVGGTNHPLRSLSISIDRGLQRNHELGSLLTKEPVEERLSIEIETTVLWQAATWHGNYLADTQGDLSLVFTGTGDNGLTLTASNLLVIDRSSDVSGPGGILETIRYKAFADATGADQGLSFSFTNDNATLTN
jgi:hypothetical protein